MAGSDKYNSQSTPSDGSKSTRSESEHSGGSTQSEPEYTGQDQKIVLNQDNLDQNIHNLDQTCKLTGSWSLFRSKTFILIYDQAMQE